MRIGELAKRLGLTSRALRWYESRGLLKPAFYNEAGHRCYDDVSLAQLQKIVSLKSLGFSLTEIKKLIDQKGMSLKKVIDQHLVLLSDELQTKQQLYNRLSNMATMLENDVQISQDYILETLKVTIMFEKYYNDEQLGELKQREDKIGPEKIEQAQHRWPVLISEVKVAMSNDLQVDSDEVQKLAQEWKGLIEAFTGNNPEIAKNLTRAHKENSNAMSDMGLDNDVLSFMGQAMKLLY